MRAQAFRPPAHRSLAVHPGIHATPTRKPGRVVLDNAHLDRRRVRASAHSGQICARHPLGVDALVNLALTGADVTRVLRSGGRLLSTTLSTPDIPGVTTVMARPASVPAH